MTTYRVAPVYAGPAITWRVIANSEYNILSWLSEHQTEAEARAEAQRLTAIDLSPAGPLPHGCFATPIQRAFGPKS
jgi:hypothetical protein